MPKGGTRQRVEGLRALLKDARMEALLVSDLKNIRYLSGFTGSNGYIIITRKKSFFLTDPRYTTQAKDEVKGFKVRIFKKASDAIAGIIKEEKIKTLGFEGATVSYDTHARLKKTIPGVRLKSAGDMPGRLRLRKDQKEISLIRDSVSILDLGYAEAEKLLAPGASERDVAVAVEYFFRKAGGDGAAFDTIVASGYRGALPHGKASSKKIKKGEFVVVDMGVLRNGYNSDETRTYCMGKATREQRNIYTIVKEAQERAIEVIRPGVAAMAVDRAARGHIEKSGYGRYFGHGTGHGVGLDIHEGPNVGPLGDEKLAEGMVITIEPGIYIPGWGGVRIEDMALVTAEGCEVLTNTSKELLCL